MGKKSKHSALVVLVVFTIGLLLTNTSCERVKNTADNLSAAEGFALSSSGVFNSLNAAVDILSQSDNSTAIEPSIVPNAKIVWDDSTFSDGTGISFLLDFGSKDLNPNGVLCGDGLYRAGIMEIKMTEQFFLNNSEWTIEFKNYYQGVADDLSEIKGKITGNRTDEKTFAISLNNIEVQPAGAESFQTLNGLFSWVQTEGFRTISLLDDEFNIRGTGKGNIPDKSEYSWNIDQNIPLVKRLELGCAITFVQGVVNLNLSEGNKSLSLDFDPYDNSSCDKVAKVLIGNRSYIISVK